MRRGGNTLKELLVGKGRKKSGKEDKMFSSPQLQTLIRKLVTYWKANASQTWSPINHILCTVFFFSFCKSMPYF